MKKHIFFAVAAGLLLPLGGLYSQDALKPTSKKVRVDISKIQVQMQKTPDFSVNNVTEKRWTPRKWLEVEVEFKAQKAANPDDKSPFIDQLEFRYFLAFRAKDAETGKTKFATGTVVHTNIEEKEDSASVMYISPSSMSQILDKKEGSDSDVAGGAVEVYFDGELCGIYTVGAGNAGWWKMTEELSDVGNLMLNKTQTPFSILWGDFHADVKPR